MTRALQNLAMAAATIALLCLATCIATAPVETHPGVSAMPSLVEAAP